MFLALCSGDGDTVANRHILPQLKLEVVRSARLRRGDRDYGHVGVSTLPVIAIYSRHDIVVRCACGDIVVRVGGCRIAGTDLGIARIRRELAINVVGDRAAGCVPRQIGPVRLSSLACSRQRFGGRRIGRIAGERQACVSGTGRIRRERHCERQGLAGGDRGR